jgi:hypothetical protein
MAILPGKRLGPYEILSAIGAGGMGEVYRAQALVSAASLPSKFCPRTLPMIRNGVSAPCYRMSQQQES